MEALSPLADRAARMRFNSAMREKGVPAKACSKCFVVKGHEAFSVRRDAGDGRNGQCRTCSNVGNRLWYAENSERAAQKDRVWRDANPDRWRELNRHSRALRRARIAAATVVPFTHDELMASWEDDGLYACVFCGGPFEEIEHILPLSRGGEHSIANLVPSCVECNRGVGGKCSRLPWEWLAERFPNLAPLLLPANA
ncbi:HNH endonuclease [Streptomyces sp. or43]|nr:HNH endonuclease [Streptomyces sp. or43]